MARAIIGGGSSAGPFAATSPHVEPCVSERLMCILRSMIRAARLRRAVGLGVTHVTGAGSALTFLTGAQGLGVQGSASTTRSRAL